MFGSRRAGRSTMLGVLAATVLAATAVPSSAQEGDDAAVAFSFVGRIEQNGLLLVNFGYVTALAGVDSDDLFANDDPLERDETNARITFFSSTRIESRSINDNLFVTTGNAETTFYFNEDGGADFDDPTSFEEGDEIATTTGDWHNVVNVIEPDTGVVTISSTDVQGSAGTFTVGGDEHTFGADGQRTALSGTGLGIRTDADEPVASFVVAGQSTVAGGDATGGEGGGEDDDDAEDDDDSSPLGGIALAVAVVALFVAVGALAGSKGRQTPRA